MSRTMQQVKAARAVRGRKWDQEAERCATCAHHVNHQYCDLHKTDTRDNGGARPSFISRCQSKER
jgi:hypothetical protein